jgi:hypothetical protein
MATKFYQIWFLTIIATVGISLSIPLGVHLGVSGVFVFLGILANYFQIRLINDLQSNHQFSKQSWLMYSVVLTALNLLSGLVLYAFYSLTSQLGLPSTGFWFSSMIVLLAGVFAYHDEGQRKKKEYEYDQGSLPFLSDEVAFLGDDGELVYRSRQSK